MSAPSSSGRWRAGDANVLSTTTSGGAWPACAARSRMVGGRRRDVGDLEQRVRRRLEPHEARALGQALPQGVLARREVDVRRGRPARGPVHALQVAIGPAVDVVADEDLVPGPGELRDGRGRRRAARERDPVAPALEVGHRALEPLAGRVLAPGVLVAAARPAHAVLREGRGLVDRRRDGAGRLVGFGARVDRARGEGVARRRVGRIGVVHAPIIASLVTRFEVPGPPSLRHCPMAGRARGPIVEACPATAGATPRTRPCAPRPPSPSACSSPRTAPIATARPPTPGAASHARAGRRFADPSRPAPRPDEGPSPAASPACSTSASRGRSRSAFRSGCGPGTRAGRAWSRRPPGVPPRSPAGPRPRR